MNSTHATSLEEAIRQSGEGWLIDNFDPPSEALHHLRRTLEAVRREATDRFGDDAPSLSEEAIVGEFARNPARIQGFFQALGPTFRTSRWQFPEISPRY